LTLTHGNELIAPAHYGKHGPPHELWTALRRESPVHYCIPDDYPPFWAVTRHADICAISKRPDRFLSAPGIIVVTADQARQRASREGVAMMRTIIEMDPPEHRSFRKLASHWFTPRAVERLNAAVETSAREQVDHMLRDGLEGRCDFATGPATSHPLRVRCPAGRSAWYPAGSSPPGRWRWAAGQLPLKSRCTCATPGR
jgi:cytochrome P450